MRVLLVSPIDPEVPSDLKFLMGGENTYTRTLLGHPPDGVEYVHHVEALKRGEVRYGKLHKLLKTATKYRLLPLSAGTIDLEIEASYDLVHCHAYTLRADCKGRKLPVVMGDSVPNRWALESYFKQGELRLEAQYLLRSMVHRSLGVYDQDLFLGDFSALVVMSEFAKARHLRLGACGEKIKVVYPGLPDRVGSQSSDSNGRRGGRDDSDQSVSLLFAGVWFERKGGLILWKAYRRVRERLGNSVNLTILGPLPEVLKKQSLDFEGYGIVHHDFVPYDQLVGRYYPNADILVHVPPEAEGYGLVVQEAMSFGVPAVASKIGAIPEMVVDGKTGLLVEPGSVESLEEALLKLAGDAELRSKLSQAARKRFLKGFSLPQMQEKLKKIYKRAVEGD